MADTKISALTNKAVLDGTELIPIVDDPSGTPVTKRTTAQAIAALGGLGVSFAIGSQVGDLIPITITFDQDFPATLIYFANSNTSQFATDLFDSIPMVLSGIMNQIIANVLYLGVPNNGVLQFAISDSVSWTGYVVVIKPDSQLAISAQITLT